MNDHKIRQANRLFIRNQFWITPFNWLLLFAILGVGLYNSYQKDVIIRNQEEMKFGDSLRGLKQDSINGALNNVTSLEETLKLIEKK